MDNGTRKAVKKTCRWHVFRPWESPVSPNARGDAFRFVVNVQGITGKKVSYFSYPYSKVQYFGIETAGVLDIDSELVLMFNDGNRLQFDFKAKVDIKQICASISAYIL